MNTFNRFLIILLAFVITASALLVLLATVGAITITQLVPAAMTETVVGQWLSSLSTLSPTMSVLVTLVSVLVILLGLVMLWYEVRPVPRQQTLVLREDGIGRVTVRLESVHKLIAYTAAQLPSVLQVEPTIHQSPEGLTIQCRTSFVPDARLPQATSDLQERIKQVVEQHVGMRVVGVIIQAQLEPLAARGAASQPRLARRVLR